MAMRLHSRTPLLLLVLLAAVSVAGAARPAGAGSDSLDKACNSTAWGLMCAKVLGAIPETSTASPRRLAELAFQYLVKEGAALSAESASAIKAPKQPGNVPCLQSVDKDIKYYMKFLAKMAPEQSDAKFAEARDNLTDLVSAPYYAHNCENVSEPVIEKVFDYVEMLDVTADLLKNAAPAPPEADDEDA